MSVRLLIQALKRRALAGSASVETPSLVPGQEVPDVLDLSDSDLTSALDRLGRELEDRRHALGVPGVSAAVVYNRDVIWARGFGLARLDGEMPADEHTIYHQGSIAKLFTTTMMMQLRDAGALCLDDRVEWYLPEFRVRWQSGDQPPITLRQFASHTSGLPMEAPLDYIKSTQFPALDAVLASLADAHLVAPPMKEFKYSNLGFAILGSVLERVAGQEYKGYVADQILQALGMTGSGFDMRPETNSHVAVGYVPGSPTPVPGRIIDAGAFVPAGEIWASVLDMAKFISLQFQDGPVGGDQILSGTSLREMHAPIMYIDADWQEAIAFGGVLARIAGWGGLQAAGGVESFASMIAYLPDLKLGMALSMNMGVNPGLLMGAALPELISVVTRIQARDRLAQVAVDPGTLERYVGHYSWPGVSELDVRISNGRLVMETRLSGGEFPLASIREHTFHMEGGRLKGELAVFELDDTGRAKRLWVGNYPMERRGA